jgi:hypothetical protein
MLRIGLNTIGGLCIGIVSGAIIGGILGYSYVQVNYSQSPNGNPTEKDFYHFIVSGSSIFFAIMCAGFGSAVGAPLGASLGAIAGPLAKRSNAVRTTSTIVKDLKSFAEQRDAPKTSESSCQSD